MKELGNIFEGGEAVRGQAKVKILEGKKLEKEKRPILRGQITVENQTQEKQIPLDHTKPTGLP